MQPSMDVVLNAAAAARSQSYPASVRDALPPEAFADARREITSWPGYQSTPLVSLSGLASELGIAELHYKDEAGRFGLGSFKALGGAYAVCRVLQRALAERGITEAATAADLVAGAHREIISHLVVTSATDGNHGRSVAWGARLFGCRAVIFIHETVSDARRDAIAAYGADVIRTEGNYDASVRHAFAQAQEHGWHVVQDTATDTYRRVPAEITHGYGLIAEEITNQISEAPTHVIVQAGVGGLASAICLRFWQLWGERRPKFIALEPTNAACVTASLKAGEPVAIAGNTETIMAGLACGEVSQLAWEVLASGADGAIVIDDAWSRVGVRQLANPAAGDPAIVGGECSGGAVGAMVAVAQRPDFRTALALNADARVVVIGTEGATDPVIYRDIVGRSAEEVASR
jgi:diaminopropionate ammonia-lyase